MTKDTNSGFTLIEIIVSVGLFAIIMTLAAGGYLTMLNIAKNAQGVSTSIDSASFALEYLTREIRTGSAYGCATSGVTATAPNDCPSGGTAFTIKDQNGVTVVFSRQQITGLSNFGIYQTIGAVNTLLTDRSINVTGLTFYGAGAKPYSNGSDVTPAHVTMVVSGTVSTGKQTFPFTIETGATMRNVDL